MKDASPRARGPYAWVSRHPRVIDRAIAGSFLLFTAAPYTVIVVVDFFAGRGDNAWRTLPSALVALALAYPLFWRRTRPVPAAAVMVAACLVQLAFGLELVATQVAVLFMIQALAAYAPRWASWWGLGVGIGGTIAYCVITAAAEPDARFAGSILLGAFGCSLVGVAWLLGDLTRSRRLEREALSDRAERVERERERELKLAASEERTRIAREMHDIVAHSLSVIVTQADGARYAAPPSAGPVLPALETIAETARGSLTDMRRLLGVLRDDDAAPTRPASGLADLSGLIATVRSSGLDVTLSSRGERLRPALPQGAELVVFRIVQEALTNVLKHAGPGARAEVELDWRRDEVVVRVSDDGRGIDPDASPTDGHGLQGMRERLALYEGSVELSDRDGGGAQVVATLPYPTEPTDPPAARTSDHESPSTSTEKERA